MSMSAPDSAAGDEAESISDINVTPFIDVMLVLLIIFMVTAPLMMGGVRVNLPRTSGTPMPRPDKPLIVSLDAHNQVFVDKDPVPAGEAAARFRELALESETGEVFVRGDGELQYAKVMDLISHLGEAGFARVTLVSNVQPGPPSGDPASGDPAAGDPAAIAPAPGSPAAAAPAAADGAPPPVSAVEPAEPEAAAS